ncbi:YpiF family protein [Virgibacillus byunsanensis]|uniref:YpiF family protein n=1 Tax=Virgibacillus byunsanensis TaxID=570945 RepID=A0ABW3LJV5_9BACI
MKWIKSDLEQYKQAKEYVDTIVVPLIPFQLSQDDDLEKSAFQREVLSLFSKEIEKELTGRIMLMPSYNYLKNSTKDNEVERINEWVKDAKQQPFIHTFFITFDSTWKKSEQAMEGTLLWFPGIQSGDLHTKEMNTMIREQVAQIVDLIRSYW